MLKKRLLEQRGYNETHLFELATGLRIFPDGFTQGEQGMQEMKKAWTDSEVQRRTIQYHRQRQRRKLNRAWRKSMPKAYYLFEGNQSGDSHGG